MATRQQLKWRAAFLVIVMSLQGSVALLAQDIIGAADPTRDIEGGAVGVLINPPEKKRHVKRVEKPAPPRRTPQPSVQTIARIGVEKRKPRPVAPRPVV